MATSEDIRNQKEFNSELDKSSDLIQETVIKADELTESLAAALQELTRSNVGLGEARKGYRSLLNTTQKISNVQNDAARLSSAELKKLKQTTVADLKRLVIGAKIVRNKGAQNEFEESLLAASQNLFQNEKDTLKVLDQEIAKREQIEDKLGLTGSALENLNRIGIRALGGIGVNLGALQKDFDEAREAAEETAEAIVAGTKAGGKFTVLRSALPGVGKALNTALVDPLTVSLFSINSLQKAFVKVQKSSVEFGRLTGQNETIASSLNTRFADTADVLETATALSKQLGINANNAFSRDVIAAAAEIQNEMGLSVEEASKLAVVTQTTSGNFDAITESIVDSVSAFNKTNKAAVSQGVVLRDVANTSDDILVSFNNQPGALAQAAAAARRLGLDLAKIDQVATSLLDFESSIGNELEAQLLTGKNINLEKAREFALTNNLEGLSNELFSNSASIAEFSSMNRIQQEAQAKALGLSRQELAKIALQQSINLNITDSQLEAAAGVTAEDLKRVEIQERLEKAISKVTTALVGPAEILATLADSTGFIYGSMLLLGGIKFGGLIAQLATVKALSAASAASSAAAASALTLGLGAVAIIAAIAGITYAIKKSQKDMTQVSDGMIAPDGGLVVSGPKGSIQLDPNDSIVAGTNLNGNGKGNGTPEWAERLIAAVEKGGHVYIDGNKAGEALVLGTYKSA